jgi:Skp family chaperone for outer membrane proteins
MRMTWMVAALTAVGMLGLAGQARAQNTGTRVAVVNIGTVFTKYQKAINFKSEMEATLKPFKDRAEKIKKDVLAYQQGIQNPQTDPKLKEQYDQAIRALKRQLEDLDLEARKSIGAKQETHLIQLYKEVTTHIQAVASSNGIHIVLGYGEPPDADLMSFQNINRKLTGMDMGGTVPLYFHSSLDISELVVTSLNRAYAAAGGAGGTTATPTGLQK